MIRSLDCAFLFYSNYPCRLALSELNVDLPCESSVFNSEHPFAEENFQFSRSGDLASVFEELFSEQTPDTQGEEKPDDSRSRVRSETRKTQTVMDLFLSIHRTFPSLEIRSDLFLTGICSTLRLHAYAHTAATFHSSLRPTTTGRQAQIRQNESLSCER
jgi:hypothetical protein